MLTILALALAGDSLIGLWGNETTYAPQVRGALVVDRIGSRWTARIGGFEVEARMAHDTVAFVLPGGQGEFRGRIVDRGRRIDGLWVQPPGLVSRVRYATPVPLGRVGDHAWRGRVDPLDDHYALYLRVARGSDGALTAICRVPERNYQTSISWARYQVVVDGDSVRLVDTTQADIHIVGAYDAERRRLTLRWPAVDVPIVLTPRSPDQAVGFYPRTPGGVAYTYRVPLPDGDGWRTARARAVGLDEAALGALVRTIATTDPAARDAPLIQSLLVARHGRLVLDEYFYGFDAERLHDLRSAGKTFTSVMLGAAMDHGAPVGVGTSVYSVLASRGPFADPDGRKARITVAHLLTHSTGLACDDNDDASPGNEDRMYDQEAQPDWYRYTLDLPVARAAGETYAYCSGGMNLVGAVVRTATGTWLPAFFQQRVATPLEIRRWAMNLMPTGEGYSGGGLYLRPRDLLKLGAAYLAGGVWNGHRLVSAAWVRQSTAHQIDASPESSDGYAWHRYTLHARGRAYQEYEASGNGGQLLIVVPDLDLAVVFTAANYQRYRVWRTFRDEIVPRVIIPAIQDGVDPEHVR